MASESHFYPSPPLSKTARAFLMVGASVFMCETSPRWGLKPYKQRREDVIVLSTFHSVSRVEKQSAWNGILGT